MLDNILDIFEESFEPKDDLVHGKAVGGRFECFHDVTVYEDGYERWYYVGD